MNLYSQLYNLVQNGMSVFIVTIIACPAYNNENVGQMLLLYPDGRVEGELIDQFFTEHAVRTITKLIWEQPTVIDLSYKGESGYKIFWDRPAVKHKAVVFGAGHISQYLVDILAMLDYEVTVVDDRPDFANKQRFPKAKRVLLQSFKQALENICPSVDVDTALIIVTRGHQYDLQCLRAVVNTKAGYLGMIGSKSRVKGLVKNF